MATVNKGGRPRANSTRVEVKFRPDEVFAVNNWRAEQSVQLSFPMTVRLIVRKFLLGDAE